MKPVVLVIIRADRAVQRPLHAADVAVPADGRRAAATPRIVIQTLGESGIADSLQPRPHVICIGRGEPRCKNRLNITSSASKKS